MNNIYTYFYNLTKKMLAIRNGSIIRVHMIEDTCWNTSDKWTARNLYAKFISFGYTVQESGSLASAGVWKKKWPGTTYPLWIENTLSKHLDCGTERGST